MKSTALSACLAAVIAVFVMTDVEADEPGTDRPASKSDASGKFIGKEPGQIRDDNRLKMEFIWCPAGKFRIGGPKSEDGQRIGDEWIDVQLTNGFWLAKFEVTQSQWKQVMNSAPWKGNEFVEEGPDFPATYVNWHDAMDFCCKLNELERQAGRLPDEWEYTLPTAAQWERACRAGTETKYSFGDDESKLGAYGWFYDNASKAHEKYAHRVGQKKANPWGLFDMHGNVWEWCLDLHSGNVTGFHIENVPGGRDPLVERNEKTGFSIRLDRRAGCDKVRYGPLDVDRGIPKAVIRGGGWDGTAPGSLSGVRFGASFANWHSVLGFRPAISHVRQVE